MRTNPFSIMPINCLEVWEGVVQPWSRGYCCDHVHLWYHRDSQRRPLAGVDDPSAHDTAQQNNMGMSQNLETTDSGHFSIQSKILGNYQMLIHTLIFSVCIWEDVPVSDTYTCFRMHILKMGCKHSGWPKMEISIWKRDDKHRILGYSIFSCQECSSVMRTSQQSPLEQGSASMALWMPGTADFGCPLKALANHHRSLVSDPFDVSWIPMSCWKTFRAQDLEIPEQVSPDWISMCISSHWWSTDASFIWRWAKTFWGESTSLYQLWLGVPTIPGFWLIDMCVIDLWKQKVPQDVYLAYLPLAHIMEMAAEVRSWAWVGGEQTNKFVYLDVPNLSS